jgi:hypothetical protein
VTPQIIGYILIGVMLIVIIVTAFNVISRP